MSRGVPTALLPPLLSYPSGMLFSAVCAVGLLFTILLGITTDSDCPG